MALMGQKILRVVENLLIFNKMIFSTENIFFTFISLHYFALWKRRACDKKYRGDKKVIKKKIFMLPSENLSISKKSTAGHHIFSFSFVSRWWR